jgi:hypothetical protein
VRRFRWKIEVCETSILQEGHIGNQQDGFLSDAAEEINRPVKHALRGSVVEAGS